MYIKELSPWSPDYSNNYEDRLKELRMLSLKDKWIQFDMVQTFKIVREIDRVDRRVWFEFVGDSGERVTRLSVDPLNIKSNLSNTELRRRFFSNRLVQQWDNLQKKCPKRLAPLKVNIHSENSASLRIKMKETEWKNECTRLEDLKDVTTMSLSVGRLIQDFKYKK